MTLDDIKAALPSLSARDRAELVVACKALGQFAGTSPKASADYTDVDIMINAIAEIILAKTGAPISTHMMRTRSVYSSFAAKCAGLFVFLRKIAKTRAELMYVSTLACELLYDDLMRMNTSASEQTMMAQIHRLPSILNRSFPGYAQAGLLGMIINHHKAAHHVRK